MLLSFFEVYFSKYCCLLVFLFFTSFFWKKVVVYGFFVGFVSFLQGIIDCFRNYSFAIIILLVKIAEILSHVKAVFHVA